MFGTTKKRKRSYKYKVTVKGVRVSRHYTMVAARRAAKRIRGARFSRIGSTYRRSSYSRRRY